MNYLDKIKLAAENREMVKNASIIAEEKALLEAMDKVKSLADEAIEIIEVVQSAIEKGFISEKECWSYVNPDEPIFQFKPQGGNCPNYSPIHLKVDKIENKPRVISICGMGVGILRYTYDNTTCKYERVSNGKCALGKSKEKSDNWECFYNEFGDFKKRVYEYIDEKISPFLQQGIA